MAPAARRLLLATTATAALALTAALPAAAAPGDVHRVSAERANLRAGPSDTTNVRGQLGRGDQLVELAREGDWYGVRVERTGEEGWIFGDLVERVSQSTLLGASEAARSAGFLELSENFDKALRGVAGRLGRPMAERVSQGEGGTLRVTADRDWLRDTSRDAHLMAALAVYQMWKNHQNNGPVRVVLLDGERPYVTIADEAEGPRVALAAETDG
jgi:SH3-like domain-containing protein